ncbi:MAG: VOC family protein [Undibacterium sp.]|uniref:VOC family protein n=1 Tax=Undibacterium sp. TaxID=1914977 RepID=UPI002717CE7C|nr:VOC family protein [Undibacterium sp.]MDO8654284.1 VOC family protein [Undibacterium sp.]
MITQLRHTGLVVADLDKALHFWRDVLGFQVARQMEESGPHIDAMMGLRNVRVTTAKLTAPEGGMIELLHFHSHPDRPVWTGTPHSTGFTHVAMTVVDLAATCKKLAVEGVTFFAPPQLSPDGNVRVTYCQGPEGVLLELVEMLRT